MTHGETAAPGAGIAREVKTRTGGRLYTREAGEGPALLLLHAFPLNGRMWIAQLDALKSRARVVAPDLPGFGLTPVPRETQSLDGYAEAVLDVLDALEIDRVIVAGLSMGGYLAFRLIEPLGARLAGLFLADTRPAADAEEEAARRHLLAAEVEREGVDVAANEVLPKLLGDTTRRTRAGVFEQVRALIRENTPAGVAAALRAMAGRPDSTGLLSRIRCPVDCITGEEDAITPPALARDMVERISGARLVVVPEAGHLSSLEAPAAFNEALASLVVRAGEAR
ncbi:MAG: alpha/beta fold hydrolase [Candidatus Binatia bacterium]